MDEYSDESTEPVISEECLVTLSSLIQEGDCKAVKSYIAEEQITPQDVYGHFSLSYVFDFKLHCPVGLAAKCGHVLMMKTLINAGFSVNERKSYFDNVRPIDFACEGGCVDVVRTLVEEYGVDITPRDKCYGSPPMYVAAERGNLEIVRFFIEKGIEVNSRFGDDSYSALHVAAEFNQADVCKYLLSVGADVNIGNTFNNTPLMYTAYSASYASARVLLDAGADVNATNNQDETAFLKAAEYGDLRMMKLLQSHGADPELDDRFYSSPLHKAVSDNRRDIVYYLVNELNVTIKPVEYYEELRRGQTVCRLALKECHYDMVRHLFNAGYDPSVELAEYVEGDDDTNSSAGSSEESNSASPRMKRKPFSMRGDRIELIELTQLISRPRSLISLCVLKVRRLLGRRLPVDLGRLPLPEILKNVIVSCGET